MTENGLNYLIVEKFGSKKNILREKNAQTAFKLIFNCFSRAGKLFK